MLCSSFDCVHVHSLRSLTLLDAHFTPLISGSTCEKQPGTVFIIQR